MDTECLVLAKSLEVVFAVHQLNSINRFTRLQSRRLTQTNLLRSDGGHDTLHRTDKTMATDIEGECCKAADNC